MKIKQFKKELFCLDIRNCDRYSLKHWIGSGLLRSSFWWMKSVKLDRSNKVSYTQYTIHKESTLKVAAKIFLWVLPSLYAMLPYAAPYLSKTTKEVLDQTFKTLSPTLPLKCFLVLIGGGLFLKGCALLDRDIRKDYQNYFKLKAGEVGFRHHGGEKKELIGRLSTYKQGFKSNDYRKWMHMGFPPLLRSMLDEKSWRNIFSTEPVLFNHWQKETQALHGPKISGLDEEAQAPSSKEFGSYSVRWGYKTDYSLVIFIRLEVLMSKGPNYIILDSNADWKSWTVRTAGEAVDWDGLKYLVDEVEKYPIVDSGDYKAPNPKKSSDITAKGEKVHAVKAKYLVNYIERILQKEKVGVLSLEESDDYSQKTVKESDTSLLYIQMFNKK